MLSIAALSLALLFVGDAHAFFRMPCSGPLVVERADPIRAPGKVSSHLHTITGGNGFDFNTTFDAQRASTCSTCKAKADLSNYWTPALHYQTKDGKFERVHQAGMTVYYLQRTGFDGEKLLAFPPGFRMIAGSSIRRSFDGNDTSQQAVTHVCLDYSGSGAGSETPAFPDHKCPNGMRTQVFFPSCWDGKNVDSEDHASHVAYPAQFNNGACPDTHPVHLISIFYEVNWSSDQYNDDLWHEANGQKHPFVLSNGDATGYGFHGDFSNGWDVDILQKSVDECNNNSGRVEDCPVLELRTDDEMNNCALVSRVNEKIDGALDALPGCNPITVGPENAPQQPSSACGASEEILPKSYTGLPPVDGWTPLGCAKDSADNRSLEKKFLDPNGAMTPTVCAAICTQNNYSFAGVEFKNECWCGNSFDSAQLGAGGCTDACEGDSSLSCGGGQRLSMYQQGAAPPVTPEPPVTEPSASTPLPDPTTSTEAPAETEVPPAESSSETMTSTDSPASPSETETETETESTDLPAPTLTQSTETDSSSLPPLPTDLPSVTLTPTENTPAPTPTEPVQSGGWSDLGCYVDTVNPRSLTGAKLAGGQTPSDCQNVCDARGFQYAGTEHGGECFCANELGAGTVPAPAAECNIACEGDASFMCGGSARLNLYQKGAASVAPAPAPNVTPSESATVSAPQSTTTSTRHKHWHHFRPTSSGASARRTRRRI
ncbi:WSC-domain-containing protein [Auriculariales sp. MPI-PUGE-AT-0066]|nr:WSC-domain-containing protein [Auriculariales sp. MPI-PUGE-AT-0066]